MVEDKANEADSEHGAATSTGATAVAVLAESWLRASIVGVGVFAYFAVMTVWLPSRLLQLGAVESSDSWVQDLAVTGSWAAALAVGVVGLRLAQRRGWI